MSSSYGGAIALREQLMDVTASTASLYVEMRNSLLLLAEDGAGAAGPSAAALLVGTSGASGGFGVGAVRVLGEGETGGLEGDTAGGAFLSSDGALLTVGDSGLLLRAPYADETGLEREGALCAVFGFRAEGAGSVSRAAALDAASALMRAYWPLRDSEAFAAAWPRLSRDPAVMSAEAAAALAAGTLITASDQGLGAIVSDVVTSGSLSGLAVDSDWWGVAAALSGSYLSVAAVSTAFRTSMSPAPFVQLTAWPSFFNLRARVGVVAGTQTRVAVAVAAASRPEAEVVDSLMSGSSADLMPDFTVVLGAATLAYSFLDEDRPGMMLQPGADYAVYVVAEPLLEATLEYRRRYTAVVRRAFRTPALPALQAEAMGGRDDAAAYFGDAVVRTVCDAPHRIHFWLRELDPAASALTASASWSAPRDMQGLTFDAAGDIADGAGEAAWDAVADGGWPGQVDVDDVLVLSCELRLPVSSSIAAPPSVAVRFLDAAGADLLPSVASYAALVGALRVGEASTLRFTFDAEAGTGRAELLDAAGAALLPAVESVLSTTGNRPARVFLSLSLAGVSVRGLEMASLRRADPDAGDAAAGAFALRPDFAERGGVVVSGGDAFTGPGLSTPTYQGPARAGPPTGAAAFRLYGAVSAGGAIGSGAAALRGPETGARYELVAAAVTERGQGAGDELRLLALRRAAFSVGAAEAELRAEVSEVRCDGVRFGLRVRDLTRGYAVFYAVFRGDPSPSRVDLLFRRGTAFEEPGEVFGATYLEGGLGGGRTDVSVPEVRLTGLAAGERYVLCVLLSEDISSSAEDRREMFPFRTFLRPRLAPGEPQVAALGGELRLMARVTDGWGLPSAGDLSASVLRWLVLPAAMSPPEGTSDEGLWALVAATGGSASTPSRPRAASQLEPRSVAVSASSAGLRRGERYDVFVCAESEAAHAYLAVDGTRRTSVVTARSPVWEKRGVLMPLHTQVWVWSDSGEGAPVGGGGGAVMPALTRATHDSVWWAAAVSNVAQRTELSPYRDEWRVWLLEGAPSGPVMSRASAEALLAGRPLPDGRRVAAVTSGVVMSDPTQASGMFSNLQAGAEFSVAAVEYTEAAGGTIGSGVTLNSWWEAAAWTRAAASSSARVWGVGPSVASISLTVWVDDPCPGRLNEVRFAAAAMALSGDSGTVDSSDSEARNAVREWLLSVVDVADGGAAPDPPAGALVISDASGGLVMREALLGSAAEMVRRTATASYQGLDPGTDYVLLWVVLDARVAGAAGVSEGGTPFKTRLGLSATVRPSEENPEGAAVVTVDAPGASSEQPFRVELLVRPESTLVGADLSSAETVGALFLAAADVEVLSAASGAAGFEQVVALRGLVPGRRHAVLVLATDAVSGFSAFDVCTVDAGSSGPSLAFVSSVSADRSLTVYVDVGDDTSTHVVTAGAWATALGPAPVPELESGLSALLTNTWTFPAAAWVSASYPQREGASRRALLLSGLEAGTDYAVVVAVTDGGGSRSMSFVRLLGTLESNALQRETDFDDAAWTMLWRSGTSYELAVRGAECGNGKLRLRASVSQLGFEGNARVASPSLLPAPLPIVPSCDGGRGVGTIGSGRSASTVSTTGFDAGLLSFESPAAMAARRWAPLPTAERATRVVWQSLNMFAGVVTTAADVSLGAGGSVAAVCQMFAPRQLPGCAVTTVRATSTADAPSLVLYHHMAAPGGERAGFGAGPVLTGASGWGSVFLFSGRAAGGAGAASAYLFHEEEGAVTAPLGHDVFRGSTRAFVAVPLALEAGVERAVTVVTAHVSGRESDDAEGDARRMVLGLLASRSRAGRRGAGQVADMLRAEHARAWAAAWESCVMVEPRSTLSVDSATAAVRRSLKAAQYSLLSAVPDASERGASFALAGHGMDAGDAAGDSAGDSAAVAPGGLGAAWSRELWLLPALLYLRPRAARSLLEERHESLADARREAAWQGRDGARFGYLPAAAGGGGSALWDMGAASLLWSTALVALGAWDYYRVTQDFAWLAARGYALMSEAAHFLCSSATLDETTGLASFGEVRDLNGEALPDAVFTVHAARLALRAAIECTYHMRTPTPTRWEAVWAALRLGFQEASLRGVRSALLRWHADWQTADGFGGLLVAEPLVAMHCHYARPAQDPPDNSLPPRNDDAAFLDFNRRYFQFIAPAPGFPATAASLANGFAALTAGAATARTGNAAFVGPEADADALIRLLEDATCDVWGALSARGGGAGGAGQAVPGADLGLCAMLVLLFVTGFCGVRVAGGFQPTGITYEQVGLQAVAATSRFPAAWRAVTLSLGSGYPARVPGAGGVSITARVRISNLTPAP